MKKVLIIGRLKNHEINIMNPLLLEFQRRGIEYSRFGGISDFFEPDYRTGMVHDWVSVINTVNFSLYDSILFVDSWNYCLPLLTYQSYGRDFKLPKISALCHGSLVFENDVASKIPKADSYERYLLDTYDNLFVPNSWLKYIIEEKYGEKKSLKVCKFPLDNQIFRKRPEIDPKNTIIFAHRWNEDKGVTLFLEFMKKNPQFSYIICDSSCKEDLEKNNIKNVLVTGWLTQIELRDLCSVGGYAWSSVKSETIGYAIYDLISYGLHPLLIHHAAYAPFPWQFKWNFLSQAVEIVKNNLVLSNENWEEILNSNRNNTTRLVDVIVGE